MQRKRTFITTVLVFLGSLLLSIAAHASTFKTEDGKELNKGEVIRLLMKDPKAKVFKIDRVMLNERTMTIKNLPKDEQ